MAESYVLDENIIAEFASQFTAEQLDSLFDECMENGQKFYDEEGKIDGATTLQAEYFSRAAFGEFSGVQDFLSFICVHVENDTLRESLITRFDLSREFIEDERED